MGRCGTATEHCCWFNGEQCQFVRRSTAQGFYWACSLREKYGDWKKVHRSPEYLNEVKPLMVKIGYKTTDCGDWPPVGIKCGDCGETG